MKRKLWWMKGERGNAYIVKVSNTTEDEVDGWRIVANKVTVVCLYKRVNTR